MTKITKSRFYPYLYAFWPYAFLIAIGLLFFWRVWTPFESDRVSFTEGDFSGQFVAWTHYAADRLQQGEIPQWNPYQYGGMPFQADPQVELTYPPRMLTLFLLTRHSDITPQAVYTALQWEIMLHVLAASILMFIFVRRFIQREKPDFPPLSATTGGLIAGIAYAYGGYLTGYPILQIPLLEAGIWLPLILFGILEATQNHLINWRYLAFSGAAIAMSLLAGHPQTNLFTVYMAIFFLGYRLWQKKNGNWKTWLKGVLLLGIISGGLAAVQLLPAAELTLHTSRPDFTFAAKSYGYLFEEFSNILFPVHGKIWIPLYFGCITLILAGIAIWQRVPGWAFFTIIAAGALIFSLGEKTVLYHIFYVLLPGVNFFRGQERATFLIAHSVAILAGLGTAHLLNWPITADEKEKLRRGILSLLAVSAIFTGILFLIGLTEYRTLAITDRLESGAFAVLILVIIILFLPWFLEKPADKSRQMALVALLVFDLFSASLPVNEHMNYEPIPVHERLHPPAYVVTIQENLTPGDRADSLRGLPEGSTTTYRLPGIYGSNPLQLEAIRYTLEELPEWLRWELLGVGVILSDWAELPFPAQKLETVNHNGDEFFIWKLDNPRGFAYPVYAYMEAFDDESARTWLNHIDVRQTALLKHSPGPLPDAIPEEPGSAQTVIFTPEHIEIQVDVPDNAIITLALPDYPGWTATLDGNKTDILRNYGGLSAVYTPTGQHTLTLDFQSRLLPIGATISAITLLILAGMAIWRKQQSTL